MKNLWKLMAALALCAALLTSTACAQARYPEAAGAVTDDTNALSAAMTADLKTYADKAEDEFGAKIRVALVYFLDGENAQTYADTLFARWTLDDDALLIVGAVGEDAFAASAGKNVKLSKSSLNSLLYSSGFSEAFKARQYDAAFGQLFVAMNDQLGKQYDDTLKLGSLFAAYQPAAQATAAPQATTSPADYASTLWNSALSSVAGSVDQYEHYHEQRGDDSEGMTPTGWIVLAVIILIVFGQSEPARKSRRRYGCGCSPIGWLFGAIGLNALFNRHRGPSGPHGPRRGPRF